MHAIISSPPTNKLSIPAENWILLTTIEQLKVDKELLAQELVQCRAEIAAIRQGSEKKISDLQAVVQKTEAMNKGLQKRTQVLMRTFFQYSECDTIVSP
jgi:uncharacterized protein (DUF3084 family)